MSEEFNDDNSGIKSLREAQEKLSKQNAELLAQLNKYQAQEKAQSVTSYLKGKGVSEKVAKLYVGDDTSETALDAWLQEYAEVFNPQQSAEDKANSEAAQRVNGATGGATTDLSPRNYKQGETIPVGDAVQALHQMQTLPVEELQRMGWLPK